MTDKLKTMKQYFVGRDLFCKAFTRYVPSFIDVMWDKGCDFMVGDFKMFRCGDEFYILHLVSGTMINWYKNLGRTNTCNKQLTFNEFMEFLLLLREDMREEGLL
jgi:hypothetical protein